MSAKSPIDGMINAMVDAQESGGQLDILQGNLLPKKDKRFQPIDKGVFKKMGIRFVGDQDELFYRIELPAGWSMHPARTNLWSYMVDQKMRVRAKISYKAAFYDRRALVFVVEPNECWECGKRDGKHWGECDSLGVYSPEAGRR